MDDIYLHFRADYRKVVPEAFHGFYCYLCFETPDYTKIGVCIRSWELSDEYWVNADPEFIKTYFPELISEGIDRRNYSEFLESGTRGYHDLPDPEEPDLTYKIM